MKIPAAKGKLAGTYTFAATYNIDGSLRTSRFPAAGGLATETLTYAYDDLGAPTTLDTNFGETKSGYVASTVYSEIGQLLQTRFNTGTGGSVYQDFTYEVDTDRLHQASVSRTSVTPNEISDITYTYDESGNILKTVDAPKDGQTDIQCFRQDYLGRLSQAWTPKSGDCQTDPTTANLGGPAPYWQSFTYDQVGNRTKLVDHSTTTGEVTTNYTTPAPKAAQPHTLTTATITDQTGTRTQNYTYDTAGNALTRPGTTPSATQTLTWDPEGRVSKITEAGKDTTFVYGADGARLIRRDNTGSTLYLGAMELRLDKTTNTVNCTRYYQHATGAIAVRTSRGLTWLANDPQGTSTLAITATNQQALQRRQTPFGNPRGTTPTNWPTEKGFVGGDQDPTGLTHLGAREYDPQLGRFISVDPILNIGDPQQMHGYAYANNNPINRSDPTGLISIDWSGIVGEAAKFAEWIGIFGICEGLIGEGGALSAAACGAAASAGVYGTEVLAGEHEFVAEDIVHEMIKGALFGFGAELLAPLIATVLRGAAVLIRRIGAKVFGKNTEKIAAAAEREAARNEPGGGDSKTPKETKPGGDGKPGDTAKPGDPKPTTEPNKPAENPTTGKPENTKGSNNEGPGTGKSATHGSRGPKGKFKPTVTIHEPGGAWTLESRVSDGNALRDAAGMGITSKGQLRTWTSAINTRTGQIAVANSGGGNCAETNILEYTGWSVGDTFFNRAARYFEKKRGAKSVLIWDEMPICVTCQTIIPEGNIVPGAMFEGVE